MNPPKPPLMRAFKNYHWVNEWETIDWYTDKGQKYERELSLFERLFDSKLKKALEKNAAVAVE